MNYPIGIVRGNWFRFHHPLEKVVWTENQKTIVDYIPQEGDKITVTLQGAYTPYEMENVTIEGNVLKYENNGTLPCGLYDVVINVVLADGKRLRSHQDGIVKVVKTNKEASIPDYVEFGVDTYELDGAVFMYVPNSGGSFEQAQADWTENDSTKPSFINHKPTIPSAQIQADWNQSDNTKADYIKNKPTIPDTTNFIQKSQTVGLVKNDGTIDSNTYLTQQDISGKEDKFAIVTPTLDNNNAFNAIVGNYYKVTGNVNAIDITLVTPSDATKLSSCIFLVDNSSGVGVNFSTQNKGLYQSANFAIEQGKIYEVNALYNGTAWYLTQVEMEVTT